MADELVVTGVLKIDNSPVKQVEAEGKKLEKAVNKIEGATQKVDKEQKKAFGGFKKKVNGVTSATETLNGKLKNTSKKARSIKEEVKNLAKGFIALNAIKNATTTLASFEDEMLRVKALTGATAIEYAILSKEARNLGASTAFSASDVARAQGNLAQSGFKTNEILAMTGSVLSVASASQLDLATSSEIVSKSLRIFRLEASESGRVADVLAKGQATSAANTRFLSSALNNAGASAKAMGYDIEDVVAIVGQIAPAFAEGSSAGTSVNAMLRDMTKNKDKLEKLGVVITDSSGNFRDFTDIMSDYEKATKSMTASEKKETQAKIFGDEAQKGVNSILAAGTKNIKEYEKQLRSSKGVASATAKIMESGLGGSLRGLKSATEGLAIGFATTLQPVLMATIEGITTLISITTKAFEVINKYDFLQSLAAGLITATIAVKTLTFAFNLLNISNPFGWIALGVTGITLLEKKFKVFSRSFKWVKGLFSSDSKTESATDKVQVQEKLATGTRSAKGGLTLVGERGPELVNMPAGAEVFNNSDTRNIYNSYDNRNIPQGAEVFNSNDTRNIYNSSNKQNKSFVVQGDTITLNVSVNSSNGDDITQKIKDALEQHVERKRSRMVAMYKGV